VRKKGDLFVKRSVIGGPLEIASLLEFAKDPETNVQQLELTA
jgi:hypothetical protein